MLIEIACSQKKNIFILFNFFFFFWKRTFTSYQSNSIDPTHDFIFIHIEIIHVNIAHVLTNTMYHRVWSISCHASHSIDCIQSIAMCIAIVCQFNSMKYTYIHIICKMIVPHDDNDEHCEINMSLSSYWILLTSVWQKELLCSARWLTLNLFSYACEMSISQLMSNFFHSCTFPAKRCEQQLYWMN